MLDSKKISSCHFDNGKTFYNFVKAALDIDFPSAVLIIENVSLVEALLVLTIILIIISHSMPFNEIF